ncbi:MAG: DUF6489 family protein [Alphaproteobacteria bacterium]
MKIKIDIDCTPLEARSFFGLPDLGPLQAALLGDIEQRMRAALGTMDPEAMVKMWLPAGMQGLEQFQKLFWPQGTATGPGAGGGAERKGK